MTTRQYSSRSQQSTLTAAITAGSTSIVVVSGTTLLGGVTIPAGRTFTLVIDPDTALEEIVDATAVSTNTFTITRAVDGSTAQAHSAGAVVRHMAIGRDFRDANLHAEADASYNDGAGNAHTMHGIAAGEGVVVGTLKTQTLTNKTLTSPTISNPTFTGTATAEASIVFEGTTPDAFETTLTVVDPTQDNTITLPNTTGTVVIANAAQTLTNKTIDMTGVTLTGLSSAGMVATSATPKNYVDSILGSATAAETSAASAATSAASAATSASSALTSANSASTSATAAATSATSAANSATSANNSANNASASSSAASASAASAATSATSAATSASSASTSASSALTSANSASTSASSALTSANSAATSATAAASSAFIADTQSYAASVSASSAAASATAAATSASSAATSASSAAASAAAAAGYVVPSQTGNAGEMLITNGTTTNWSNNVIANTTATVGLIVSAHVSGGQTADLQRWTGASTSTVLASVNKDGYFSVPLLADVANTGSYMFLNPSGTDNGAFKILTRSAANKGLIVMATASQTANLQEWQNSSGTVVLRVANGGQLYSGSSYFANAAGFPSLNAVATSTTGTPIVAQGVASQTADLQQWQNSSGTVLLSVGSDGIPAIRNSDFGANSGFPTLNFSTGATVAGIRREYRSSVSRFGVTTGTFHFGGDLDNSNFAITDNQVGVFAKSTTLTPFLVKGVASQSADLVQIQDSSGNIVNAFDNQGNQRSEAQLIQYGAEGSLLQNIPTRVHPAETLLKQAVWWIDSAHPSASAQTIRNLGWGGTALDVTNGSSTSADSNDAKYLDWDGINYVYLPGTAYNYISVADSAPLDITGDIDIRLRLAMDDWTDSSAPIAISKWNSTGNQKSYLLRFLNGGGLRFAWTTDGNVSITRDSTASVPFTDGTVGWIRATLDVDNGASGHDVKFFTSNDGITWTQLGNTVTTAGITSIYSGTASILIGGNEDGSSLPIAAKQYRAQILNGIDGVPVLDIDTSVVSTGAATSFTALTGQTVFINRSTSGRKTVCVTNPLWLFGTDDYMEVNNRWLEHTGSNYLYLPGVAGNYASAPDSAALDITGDIDIRCKVALDDWTPASASTLIGKLNATGNQKSYRLTILTDGRLFLQWSADGSAESSAASTVAPTVTDGSTLWIRAALDVDNGASGNTTTFYTSTDGTTWTQLGNTVTNAGVTSIYNSTSILEVGSHSSGASSPARGKFFRAQVLNGIGGTVAFDANFETGITSNLPTTFTESSANSATVTINYSGTGYRSAGVIASTYVFPGNPNTFKLSTRSLLDFGASDSFTAMAIYRQWATPADFGSYIYKRSYPIGNDLLGYDLGPNGTTLQSAAFISDGTNFVRRVATSTYPSGTLNVHVGLIDRTAQTSTVYQNNVASASSSISSIGSLSNLTTLMIGRLGLTYQSFELVGAVIFRRALTASEIAILNNYFQGRIA